MAYTEVLRLCFFKYARLGRGRGRGQGANAAVREDSFPKLLVQKSIS